MYYFKLNETRTMFDIIGGISYVVLIMSIDFSFLALSPSIFLQIIMLSFYIFALLNNMLYNDKVSYICGNQILELYSQNVKVYRWDNKERFYKRNCFGYARDFLSQTLRKIWNPKDQNRGFLRISGNREIWL